MHPYKNGMLFFGSQKKKAFPKSEIYHILVIRGRKFDGEQEEVSNKCNTWHL
jgi:hypothetical protein